MLGPRDSVSWRTGLLPQCRLQMWLEGLTNLWSLQVESESYPTSRRVGILSAKLHVRFPWPRVSRERKGLPCLSSRLLLLRPLLRCLDSSCDSFSRPSPLLCSRRNQTCHFGEHATSAPAELAGEIHNVSQNRARTQVLPHARKLHVYGSGTFMNVYRWFSDVLLFSNN